MSRKAAGSPILSSCLVLIPLVAAGLLFRPAEPDLPNLAAYPWLYLRDGKPLGRGEQAVELVAVGDVMLGRQVADQPDPFGDVSSWLQDADLALGNLECVITGSHDPKRASALRASALRPSTLRAPPASIIQLRDAGFDLLGLANNHALDLGGEGLAESTARLERAGMAAVGAGPDVHAAYQPCVPEVAGVRLAVLAFNGVAAARGAMRAGGWTEAYWDPVRATTAVAAAQERADAVVVSIHWGYEYEGLVDPAQRDAARALLDAGADLVIGHHPHVVQPFEVRGDRFVAYSLGNFVFDQGQGETGQGLALRAFFDKRGLRAVQALPVWAGTRPRLMRHGEADALLASVEPPPARLTFNCDEEACHRSAGQESAHGAEVGLFWGGRIDLTGDGVPEHVRRVAEQIVVYSGGGEAWRSPPEWRVVDAALGDPNADGRGEVLMALWKTGLDGLETPSPEKELFPRSHPFIVGYRGGVYRTLWGGSAVAKPIHEVELGDVTGDGFQELMVLEGDEGGERTVSLWRWHGWGFSLLWRSEPAAYRDLVLSEGGTISVAVD
jgi:poly-gamma-glutamate synthesis protein (capsule biosynthesis protein)